VEIHETGPGAHAPDDSDRVVINVLPSGKAGFSGIYQAGTVTAHTVSMNNFESEEEAFQAAIIWAQERRINVLYVERPDA